MRFGSIIAAGLSLGLLCGLNACAKLPDSKPVVDQKQDKLACQDITLQCSNSADWQETVKIHQFLTKDKDGQASCHPFIEVPDGRYCVQWWPYQCRGECDNHLS